MIPGELQGIELRPTRDEDCPELVQMHLAAHREAYAELLSEEFFAAREAQVTERIRTQREIVGRSAMDGGQHWIALDTEGIVGFAHSGAARPVERFSAPRVVELYGLYILARVYGRGLGRALVQAALADQPAYLWVLRDNPRAQAFYRKLGFRENGVSNVLTEQWEIADRNPDGPVRAARRAPEPVAGEYPIDTGLAELTREPGAPDSWLLTINGMQSSHIDLADPLRLDFEYMRWMAGLVQDRWTERSFRLRVLHLGGGACALARYLVAAYPDSRNTVVEIDAQLAALVRQWFGLPQAPLLKIRVGEARQVTGQLSPGSRDVVIRDVFSGRFTPPPLLTAEFVAQVKRVLSDTGIYLLNCGDAPSLRHARQEAATVADAFRHTVMVADPPMLKGRRYGNIVIAGSDAPLAQGPGLVRELLAGAMPATLWDDARVRTFASGQQLYRD